jgi:hypothetical protein
MGFIFSSTSRHIKFVATSKSPHPTLMHFHPLLTHTPLNIMAILDLHKFKLPQSRARISDLHQPTLEERPRTDHALDNCVLLTLHSTSRRCLPSHRACCLFVYPNAGATSLCFSKNSRCLVFSLSLSAGEKRARALAFIHHSYNTILYNSLPALVHDPP